MSRYWTPDQIADLLGIDHGKVLAWLGSGELIGIDVAERRGKKRRWRISDEDLRAFLDRRRSQPRPEPSRRSRRPQPTKQYV